MGKLTAQDKLDILGFVNSGMSQGEVANMYNVNINTVCSIVNKAKLGISLTNTDKPKKLSESEMSELLDDLKHRAENGYTTLQLSAKYGVSDTTINKLVRKHELSVHMEHAGIFNDSQKREIYKKYTEGMSVVELTKLYGVSATTLYKIINRLKESNEQIAGTIKVVTEQFNSELQSVTDCTFIDNIDKSLLSETAINSLSKLESQKNKLFEMYKEYSLELISYVESVGAVSELVRTEMEEKYRYLQSKLERVVS